MQDLKFEAVVMDKAYREVLETLKTQELLPVAQAFVSNIDRAYSLLEMPALIGHLGWVATAALYGAYKESGINISSVNVGTFDEESLSANHNDMLTLVIERFFKDEGVRKMVALWAAKMAENALYVTLNESNKFDVAYRIDKDDIARWGGWVAKTVPLTGITGYMGFRELLTAPIVGTWTAFESLAGDLWEAALNIEPGVLAKLKGIRGRSLPKDSPDSPKRIDLNLLHKYKFDMSRVMGTVLRERFSFTTLDGIQDAYRSAFSQGEEQVKEAIGENALYRLSCVRNIIVHKAGVVDAEFKRKMRSDPEYSNIMVGDPFPVDGKVTQSLVEPAVRCSVKLITAVDGWLSTHPEE